MIGRSSVRIPDNIGVTAGLHPDHKGLGEDRKEPNAPQSVLYVIKVS